MNIVKNGYVYNNVCKEYVAKYDKEVFVTSLLQLNYGVLLRYFKGCTIVPLFRVLKLDERENPCDDISKYVVSGTINVNKQRGQIRSGTLSLSNFNGELEYGYNKILWDGVKVRIDSGIIIDDILYWTPLGVFLLQTPSFRMDNSSNQISLNLVDKWGLWDGSVYGNTELKIIIPSGCPISQVVNNIVHEKIKDEKNEMWDEKEIIIESGHEMEKIYYTIRQDAGQPKAQLLLDISKTISSDIMYDANGHLCLNSNILKFLGDNYAVIWHFNEGDIDCSEPNLTYNRNNYYNKIIVKGAILNGYQFSASVENRNPKSIYNTINNPISPKTIVNSKLFSDQLCLEQGMYEMFNQSRGLLSVTITSAFIPFLTVDKMVRLNFPRLGINNQQFVIDGFSFNMGTDCKMNLKLTSNNEVIF